MSPSARDSSSCESSFPTNNLTDRLNALLNSSGSGYVLSLCAGQQYPITSPLAFASPNQEISTAGYPTDSTRAMLVVSGTVVNGTGQTTAVDGTCSNCDGVRLRNVQINGTRLDTPPIDGGANIEMGGPNSNQIIEFVHSFDPRSWSCLHVDEGDTNCSNVTVQNNDIGPAGNSAFHQYADGISVACRNSVIRNNMINNPTDGGIVLFGSPGTLVENNTIWVENQTLLGGINMVDVTEFGGSYDGVVVTNNIIAGGFASQAPQGSETKGTNDNNVVIKIGIAVGPRVWFGSEYGNNVSSGGIVHNNQLTGAFSYGVAINGVSNFTVENTVLVGNTSFIGDRGPNCTNQTMPSPTAFVAELSGITKSTTQADFDSMAYDGSLVNCVVPPSGGDLWPFGNTPTSPSSIPTTSGGSSHLSAGAIAGIVIGTIIAVALVGVATWYVRKWAINHPRASKLQRRNSAGYVLHRY